MKTTTHHRENELNEDLSFWTVGETLCHGLPQWARTTALSAGAVFVPAAIGGDEAVVALCAATDGEPTITHLGHVYVPARWMGDEYPGTADLMERIEQRVMAAARVAQEGAQGPECRRGTSGTSAPLNGRSSPRAPAHGPLHQTPALTTDSARDCCGAD